MGWLGVFVLFLVFFVWVLWVLGVFSVLFPYPTLMFVPWRAPLRSRRHRSFFDLQLRGGVIAGMSPPPSPGHSSLTSEASSCSLPFPRIGPLADVSLRRWRIRRRDSSSHHDLADARKAFPFCIIFSYPDGDSPGRLPFSQPRPHEDIVT